MLDFTYNLFILSASFIISYPFTYIWAIFIVLMCLILIQRLGGVRK